jgi:excisionase family DNA binding protein
MNKEQAAKRLGVSVRTLQRYMSAHRIAFKMRKTKTGDVAVFTKTEVARFKKELKERLTATVSPAVSPVTEPVTPAPEDDGGQVALTILQSAPPAFFEAAPELFWKRLADKLATRARRERETSTADLTHQLTLTEREAAQLAGLPLSQVRKARGELGSFKTGAGWRVRRSDLESYVQKMK